MTTQWNPAHADEEPEAAGNQAADRPAPGPAPEPSPDARRAQAGWTGYVVPEADRLNAGWAPPAADAWPARRPVGPPADSYPALRRAVDLQSGVAAAGIVPPETTGPSVPASRPDPADDAPPARSADPAPRREPDSAAPAARPEPAPRSTPGRHAAPPRSAARRRDEDDPDDDRLAAWVGSLAEVDEAGMIAGRRTGPIPAVAAADTPRGGESGTGPAPEDLADPPARTAAAAPEAGPEPAAPPSGPAESAGHGPSTGTAPDTVADDDEYEPTTGEWWQPMPATTREELITRLDALSALVGIGHDDFDRELIEDAHHLLNHAGARLRLSADHTVVALAGGTGSGKSSLFNALCGLEFSRVGITRPTTSSAHACVWGNEGAEGLLSWLGVPRRNRHSRTSELDRAGSELSGLILLDLPDHDSVRAMHTAEADRLIGACDLIVWVLDPQKYADAAVHHRYLAEMSGYGAVTVAVLNQVDRVEPDELEELLTDLRRLLETESGVQTRVLTTSTVTGQGIRQLRSLLADTVGERRALIDRLVADLDRVVVGFERYHGDPAAPGVEPVLPERVRTRLVDDLVAAAGVSAIADTAESVYEQRGAQRVGWPLGRWIRGLRRDPLRAVGADLGGEGGDPAVVEPHGAGIDKAAVAVADHAAGSLPWPWPRRVRAAARGGLDALPRELSQAVASTVPPSGDTPAWWQVVRVLQYLLTALSGAGLVWLVALLVSWLGGGLTGLPVLDDPRFLGLAAAVVVATPLVGWLIGNGCVNLVSVAAAQRRERIEQRSAQRAREIAEQRILAPVEQELARYLESCQALATAQGPRR
ncbi:GTP-binding protein EngB required for normal cell division [Streptomonospora nanhaiensis]|uniref:GTP-binding protein EngB required for normal cell division n=1 Tax=Streptomonospora nanhaiensis TaxID=1323731 RepID=A0A853BVB7_9ACTN|nr:YfjP family GTPase [Streptomonospora nanhaiensis]NYI98441.1 GTP-binding protein EngB required for normal cell division [Streptomonospora nanhaiensis]